MIVTFSSRGPLRDHWYAVARSDDVRPGPVAVELLREELVLWRGPNDRVIAVPDRCSHRNSNLSPGPVENGCLICPHHGRVFGEDGRCVDIPRRETIDEAAHLAPHRCEEHHGLVWVSLGAPRTAIPVVASSDDPAYRWANPSPATWTAPAPRILEAIVEHAPTDGNGSDFDIPFTFRRSFPADDGSNSVLLVTCSPVGAGRTDVFTALCSNDAEASREDVLAAEIAALAAMKPAVEAISGTYEIDENDKNDASSGASTWRRAFLEALSLQP